MDSYFVPAGMGWQQDVPDFRDYTIACPKVTLILESMGFVTGETELPRAVDLRDENLLPPPQDQGSLGASCAFAVLDLVEHQERKHLGRSLDGSKLFLHQLSLRFATAQFSADNDNALGTTLRNTFKALTRVGTPPASFWAYDADHFNCQPADPLLFSFTREYGSIHYFRLDISQDRPGRLRTPNKTLRVVKRLLAIGIPCVCGIAVPRSLTKDPRIPVPNGRDELRGGQAVLILGYEDSGPAASRRKSQRSARRRQHDGALLVRSSWGSHWGENGHGWLPQEYIIEGFASDFWTAVKPDWIA